MAQPRSLVGLLIVAITVLLPASPRRCGGDTEKPGAPAEAKATTTEEADRPFPVDHDAPLKTEETLDREAADHKRLRVEFNGIKGDRVPAYLYLPNDAKPANQPAVLLQYGSGGHKDVNYIVDLARQFAAKGFLVLTIDAPGRGERRGGAKDPAPAANADGDKEETGPTKALRSGGEFQWYLGDYSRAVDYLSGRPEVDPKRIGYVGISWGAITGIVFVAHEPRVAAMASIVGGGNWLGMVPAEYPEETKRIARRIDPVHHVRQIAPRPLLLLNATEDQLVRRFFGESLHKAAGDGPSVTKRWIETDHFFRGVDRFAILADVITFMETGLEAGAREEPKP